MLSQAMIASYGYAAPKLREALLRARALSDDSTDAFFGAVLLYDHHLLDVTGESLYSNAVKIVDSELSGVAPGTPLVLIGLGRPTPTEKMRQENDDGKV